MNRFEELKTKALSFYDNGDPSHDRLHIERVLKTCKRLGELENADLDVLLPAALLHDVVNVPKNHPDRLNASAQAARKARELLEGCGYTEAEVASIEPAIIEHSFSLGKKPSSLESAILQDADKLDALGAIGIMRTVTCGARMGCSYYNSESLFPETREMNDRAYTIDHFFAKLLKLESLMNTESARTEAKRRTEFMRQFLNELSIEVD